MEEQRLQMVQLYGTRVEQARIIVRTIGSQRHDTFSPSVLLALKVKIV